MKCRHCGVDIVPYLPALWADANTSMRCADGEYHEPEGAPSDETIQQEVNEGKRCEVCGCTWKEHPHITVGSRCDI